MSEVCARLSLVIVLIKLLHCEKPAHAESRVVFGYAKACVQSRFFVFYCTMLTVAPMLGFGCFFSSGMSTTAIKQVVLQRVSIALAMQSAVLAMIDSV